MAPQRVNVDNFARAETDRMFTALQQQGGGVNLLHHYREPAPLDDQPVIRQNRDTLTRARSSTCPGAPRSPCPTPGSGTSRSWSSTRTTTSTGSSTAPGEHELTVADYDTDYVLVAARILVDPNDPPTWQRSTTSRTDEPDRRVDPALVSPDYDKASSTPPGTRC